MSPQDKLWDIVTDGFRSRDWHGCVQELRTLVDADPFELVPRQILAALYLKADNPRLALIQYEKLLPVAVGKGELFRALALQKRIDEINPEARVPGRFAAMHRWFRLVGMPRSVATDPGSRQVLSPGSLLTVSPEVFENIAEAISLEAFDLEPRVVSAEGGTLWVPLYGRLRWKVPLPGGRGSLEGVATESLHARVGPELVGRAEVEFVPEQPSECLRFEASLLRELTDLVPALGRSLALMQESFTPEGRALLPNKPLRPQDMDFAPRVPAAPASAPPRLVLPGHGADSAGLAPARERDTGDWIEYGTVSLPEDRPGLNTTPAGNVPPPALLRERELELPTTSEVSTSPAGKGRPLVEPPGPLELGDGLVVPGLRDPFAEPDLAVGTPVERRNGIRVAAEIETRIALLGLAGRKGAPLAGQVTDISTTGLGMCFRREQLNHSVAALGNAVVSIDLALPEEDDPLRLAGRVRWIEFSEDEKFVRLGIEFVLLTVPDQVALAAALGRRGETAPAAGEAGADPTLAVDTVDLTAGSWTALPNSAAQDASFAAGSESSESTAEP